MKPDLSKPDPKLKEAIAEIKKVCEKYDCGGVLILANQTHGEYLVHFPTWSKCFYDGEGLRFRAKGKDDDGTVGATVSMIHMFQIRCLEWGRGFDKILEMLESKMFITGGHKKIPKD